jgi:hypothetical protein
LFRIREKGERHSPIGSAGKPTVLGAGPLEFRCIEPFRVWTATFDGTAMQTSTADSMRGSSDGPRAKMQFHIEATMPVPPWTTGEPSTEAAKLASSEGDVMGGARYEQLFRAVGVVRVGGDEQRFTGSGTRVRRQGTREMAGFWGHCMQSAVFPSGRGFGYITYRPHPDGSGSYNEGYVFTGDGGLVPARVTQAPWLSKVQANGENVALVLESAIGTVKIGGETIWSVFNIVDPTSPHALAGLYQGGARYVWDGEETYGAIERSTPPRDLAW